MEESFLPWWLLLLLGMWAVALALWQAPTIHREIRLWSGLAIFAYLGLILLALRGGFRTTGAAQPSVPLRDGLATVGSMACMAVSLTGGVWLLGRGSLPSRRISYLILTCANSGLCVLMGEPAFAIALAIVALISGWPIRESVRPLTAFRALRDRSGLRQRIIKSLQFDEEPPRQEDAGRFWLTCGVNGVLACAILGTVGYTLRVETSRTFRSSRYTSLPARDQIVPRSADSNDSVRVPTILEFAFGVRADVIVLMAVIVFLVLAISMNDSTPDLPLRAGPKQFPDSESHSQELV